MMGIEKMRKEMHKAIETYGVSSIEALKVSQQLDTLISIEQKRRLVLCH